MPPTAPLRRSLRARLTLGTMAVALFAMTALGAAIVAYGAHLYRRSLADHLTITAMMIADNSKAALLFGDREDAAEVLGSLRADGSVLGAVLYDASGAPFVEYRRAGWAGAFPGSAPAGVGSGAGWREVEVVRPVRLQTSAGTVLLRAELSEMYVFLRNILGALLGTLLAVGVAALVLTSRVQRAVTGPIESLAGLAEVVRERKDYSRRAPRAGEDELGRLTDTFNEMLGTIQERDAALRESEEMYRLLVENAGDAIFVAQDGVLTYANRRTLEITGRGVEELARSPWLDLVHPDDRAQLLERHRRRMAGEAVPPTATFRLALPGGEVRQLQMNSVAITWRGRPATLNFGRDITEQLQVEERLRHGQKMEAIGTLAGGIAHDFNNILAIITGYVEVALLKVPRESPAGRNLVQVLAAAERAASLVRQILTFSRRAESNPVLCDVRPIVKETVKFIRSSLPASIEVRENIAPVGMVLVDPTQVHQVVMNLCTNAFHAMEERGGTLEVTLAEVAVEARGNGHQGLAPGQYALLTVSDSGEGIPAENLARIFEPYFTTKDAGKGTGLGLSVVHGIVSAAGGAIKVYSEPGLGTTFHVYLPVGAQGQLPEGAPPEELLRGTERVLLVDDEAMIVDLMRETLAELGYQVTATTSPEEALALFRQDPSRFDLLLTDLTMPRLNGVDLARQVRALRPGFPVVLCSGFSEGLTHERAAALGISQVLMKPVPRARLSRAVRAALARREVTAT